MIIDANVSLGHWPFRKFLPDSAAKLSKHLESEGVSSALVSAAEAGFCLDPDIYNKLLIRKLRPYSNLMPIMVINPSLSNWLKTLRRYVDSPEIKAVKILPNYHNYSLARKYVAELMNELTVGKIPLLIQMRMEDERSHHPLLKVSGVDCKEVIKLAGRFPRIPILCLCPYFGEAALLVKETANIYVDISFVERLDTVASLLKEIPATRVLFGSHTPFLYTRSAIMKIKDASISRKDFNAIAFNNARRLFGRGEAFDS